MTEKNKKLIKKARLLFIAFLGGVVLLAIESLLGGGEFFNSFALWLGAGGLAVISLITAAIVKSRD